VPVPFVRSEAERQYPHPDQERHSGEDHEGGAGPEAEKLGAVRNEGQHGREHEHEPSIAPQQRERRTPTRSSGCVQ